MTKRVAIFGASGAIGNAFVTALLQDADITHMYAISRSGTSFNDARVENITLNLEDELALQSLAETCQSNGALDMVLVAVGALHWGETLPEKSLKELSIEKFQHSYLVNTILPAMIAKHFLPLLHRDRKAVFAALSARVGSISDNELGGWYSYRAAKAALNMLIKNAAIEIGRKYKQAVIVGLHPGTVDSHLSKPFQGHVPAHKLFTPAYAAQQLLDTLERLQPADSGKCFAYDGSEILP